MSKSQIENSLIDEVLMLFKGVNKKSIISLVIMRFQGLIKEANSLLTNQLLNFAGVSNLAQFNNKLGRFISSIFNPIKLDS